MNTTHWHFDINPNVGNIDRLVRYVACAALIGTVLVLTPTPAGWTNLLLLTAIPIVISAIVGWDPVYALFQKHATRNKAPPVITQASDGKLGSVQVVPQSAPDRVAA